MPTKYWFGRLVDQFDRLGLAFGRQDPGLPDAFGLLDLGPPHAVGHGLGGGGEVDRRDLLVLRLDDLVHRLLDVLRRVDLLQLGPDDLDAPEPVSSRSVLLQLGVDLAALAVGRLQGQRADDVTQRRPGQVDDLPVVVVDVVLAVLDARPRRP